jgi:hypothetical protein
MTKVSKNDSWAKPNEDKFDFTQHARELDAQNQFAPLDTPPGIGLRQFLDRETRLEAASSGSNETLIPGKLYLRQQPSGMWELIQNRGRGSFHCYPSESRKELLELAKTFVKEPTW